MSQKHFYNFDKFRIDAEDRVLLRDGEIIPLTQKAFDVLFLLVQRSNRIVTKEELMSEVWPDTFVEEGNLAQNIYTLRKVLGESSTGEDYIKTVPRRGYRFVALVQESWGEDGMDIPTAELMRLVDLKEKKIAEAFPQAGAAAVAKLKEYVAEKESAPAGGGAMDPLGQMGRMGETRRSRKLPLIGAGCLLLVAVSIAGWRLFRVAGSPAPFAPPRDRKPDHGGQRAVHRCLARREIRRLWPHR
jgi:DNA-binding winged helix-turn-helix (wHTH) protein